MSENKGYLNLTKGQTIALLAVAALNIIWLVCRALSFNGIITVQTVGPIVMLIITVGYALYGYKKPHGNHVRYLLLTYSVYMGLIFVANQEHTWLPVYVSVANIATIILSTYMAGRLDHYKQNLIITVVIAVLQLVHMYPFIALYARTNTLTFVSLFKSVGPVSGWLAIAISYIVRFKPHKEAGLKEPK